MSDDDFLDALADTINLFRRARCDAPAAILLATREDGERVLAEISQQKKHRVFSLGDGSMGRPVEMADGSVYMEVRVMGVAIRWPANRTATPDGSWSFT